MSEYASTYDLSRGTIRTRSNQILSRSRVEHVIDDVYDEFSGDAPLQMHLIEFSAYYNLPQARSILPKPNLRALHRFDYLETSNPSPDKAKLRTKGIIALNMIEAELYDDELSASLTEPFDDVHVLATLYRRWRASRDGWTTPPLCL